MRRIALFPGSFDPLTLGHLDLIERLSALYDEVVVGVMSNPAKKPYLEDEERLRSIERSVEHLANVRVALSHGATVDLARQCGAQVMVRGLRSVTDFEYETVLAADTAIWRRILKRCFCRPAPSAEPSVPPWCGTSIPSAATSRNWYPNP